MTLTPRYTTLLQLQSDLRTQTISCSELVEHYLQNIKKQADLNVFVEVFEDEAKAQAKALDLKLKTTPNELGRLFGIVLSIKDVICYEGHQVTAAAKILEGFTSLFSATAIERLLAEDSIIIGRVNCDQFAMGSTNENSHYGATRNALNPSKIPGGSSGASAVSVQADMC